MTITRRLIDMKSKNIITIGIFSLVIFMGIAAYLWYLYFHEYESKLLAQKILDKTRYRSC